MPYIPDDRLPVMLKLQSTVGLDNIKSLEDRVLALVDFFGEHLIAVGLQDLNRRFGKQTKALGTTMNNIVSDLSAQGKFYLRLIDGKIWLFALKIDSDSASMVLRDEEGRSQHEIRDVFIEGWVRNAKA